MALDPRVSRKPEPSMTGEHMGAGLQFAGSVLLFLFVGMCLDRKLGTDPWLLIAGVVVGSTAGFWSMYRHLVVLPRERAKKERP